MMDGFTIDDLISGRKGMFVDRGRCRGLCSWRRPDRAGLERLAPENAYRINAFLRANPDHPEPDLDLLNVF